MTPATDLLALVRRNSAHDAWRHINPMLADALRLAITGRLPFGPTEFGEIVDRFSGHHWMGPDNEVWYALAITSGNDSATTSIEAWMKRAPFLLDGERVYVGRSFQWAARWHRCTSIENDFVRAKVQEEGAPETLVTIPRAGFEERIAAQKAAEKAKRDAEREAQKADPAPLLTVREHIEQECTRTLSDRWGARWHAPRGMAEWADAYGTDYRRAWKECDGWGHRNAWARALGLIAEHSRADAAGISWPKVQNALYRTVRTVRGLPLRGERVTK